MSPASSATFLRTRWKQHEQSQHPWVHTWIPGQVSPCMRQVCLQRALLLAISCDVTAYAHPWVAQSSADALGFSDSRLAFLQIACSHA